MITFEEFEKVDIRAGRIIEAEVFDEAKTPAYKLTIDFGPEIGIKHSSAQITQRYFPTELKNRAIIAVVNIPARMIAGFKSEVLVLGMHNEEKEVVLVSPDSLVPVGSKLCAILAAPLAALFHAREMLNAAMFAMPTS